MRTSRQSIIWVWMWLVMGAGPAVAQETGAAAGSAAADRVDLDAFRAMQARDAVFVLDVRGAASYKAGHIPGAVNVPLDQIERRAAEVRAKAGRRTVVTYCSCPDEHASLAAVRLLASNGVPNARALVGGYPAWVARRDKGE